MKIKRQFCHNCTGQRDHAVMGMMPVMFTEGKAKAHWKKTLVCSVCGDINYDTVSNEEVDRAQERYLKVLVQLGLETEQSIRRKTGVAL